MGNSAVVFRNRIQLMYLGNGSHQGKLDTFLFSDQLRSSCDINRFQFNREGFSAYTSNRFDMCLLKVDGNDKHVIDFTKTITNYPNYNSMPPIIVLAENLDSRSIQRLQQCNVVSIFDIENTSSLVLARMIRCAAANKQLLNEVNEAEIRHDAVMDAIAEGVIVCDDHGNIDSINHRAEYIFGISNSNDVAAKLSKLVVKKFQKEIERYFSDKLREQNANQGSPILDDIPYAKEIEGVRTSGEVFPMELIITSTNLNNRKLYTCIVRDITLTKIREEELQLTATAFETHTAILITDAKGTILRVNPAFCAITGYGLNEIVGQNPKILQSGHHDKVFYENMWSSIDTTGKWEGEIWNKRKNGEIYPEYQTVTAVKNDKDEITHYVGTFQDITERKQTQALVEHQAFYDALTNLPNRRMILDRLNQELASSRRHKVYGALLFLDLDHFKNLNDSMGHAIGDQLLQQMARRLSNHVRIEDTVARLGGDDFVVLLTNLGAKKKSATTTATVIAKKIHRAIAKPYSLEDNSYNFTPSIGITLFPIGNDTADDVLKHADTAMYRAKNKGRNTICFYQPKMQAEADKRLRIEKEMRTAIDNHEFLLHYQPQYNNHGEVVGAEALLRWEHPKNGMVEPKDFISLAEETNLIQPIGRWVMESAVQQFMSWREGELFHADEYIAVNVSPKQLQQDDFVDQVGVLLANYDIAPKCLKLELTENLLLYDLYDVVEKMNQLKGLGVSFSMDDFGTGFSSLSYLKRLPIDQIKIDKTFIRDVVDNINDAAIVETIIAMAEHLKLDVIAEGVETAEEFEFLQRKGCNNYQGFYFGRPLDPAAFEKKLRSTVHSRKSHVV